MLLQQQALNYHTIKAFPEGEEELFFNARSAADCAEAGKDKDQKGEKPLQEQDGGPAAADPNKRSLERD